MPSLDEGIAPTIAVNLLGYGGNSTWANLPGGGAAHIHSELDELDRPLRLHLDPAIAAIDLATGALEIKATNDVVNMVYPFYLIPTEES